MTHWSIDMVRQSGWDLWVVVCRAASFVLLCYAALGRLWNSPRGLVSLILIAVGVTGTAIVLSIPLLHSPLVGLFWTFFLLSILSATFYLNLREQLNLRQTGTLLALRIFSLALLVPMLFEP